MSSASRVLQIDLTHEKVTDRRLTQEDIKKYIGGIGIAIKLLYENLASNVDPLDQGNVLILATGPTSGIMAPTGCGHVLAAKSPLTGNLAISTGYGLLGAEMKRARLDALIVNGKAKHPIFLLIHDESVDFVPALDLWGKSSERTEEIIRKNLGDTSIQVASIGLAGERLSRISTVMVDRTSIVGRGGLGAVFGSKNLKAIAVKGSHGIKVADWQGLLNFCRKHFIIARGSAASKHYVDNNFAITVKDRVWTTTFGSTARFRELGTTEDILLCDKLGCLPSRNFGANTFHGIEKVSGERLDEFYTRRVQACSSCSIGCEHVFSVSEGEYKDTVASLDYGQVWAFGPNCGVDRLDSIIKATELCNKYGLDPISTGNLIGFAFNCYENGLFTEENMPDNFDGRFSDHQKMLELIRMIGTREGFGDLLAEGVMRTAERIGKEAESLAMHVKGLEMTGYDPRCMKTYALGLAVSFQGADDERNGGLVLDMRGKTNRLIAEKGKGKLVKDIEDLYAVTDSLMICKRMISAYDGYEDFAKLYNLITGLNVTVQDLKDTGERINNLARLFSIREGFSRSSDCLPQRLITSPIPDGSSKNSVIKKEELDLMLDDYYSARNWTSEGKPTKEKLDQLEIGV